MANNLVEKLSEDKKALEKKIVVLQAENESFKIQCENMKNRIDYVISFCKIADSSSVFSRMEVYDKLCQLPKLISAYLKGERDGIEFKR